MDTTTLLQCSATLPIQVSLENLKLEGISEELISKDIGISTASTLPERPSARELASVAGDSRKLPG